MIGSEIRKIVAAFTREIPPDVSGFVSVTEVEMSPDLAHATVMVGALDRADAAVRFLQDNKGEIKRRLSKIIRGYSVPDLRFIVDKRGDEGAKIESLLDTLMKPKGKKRSRK